MAIFGYGRVSRKDQTTENQRLEIEREGYKIDYWYADDGVSGAVQASKRPQFADLLRQIRNGETLVVSKLDRLGRSAVDIGSMLRELELREISVFVLQLGKLDMTDPVGRAMLTMLSAVAELERDLLIERTQAGLERAKSQGKKLGRPPSLTEVDRVSVREQGATGVSISKLARLYGVSRATILRTVRD